MNRWFESGSRAKFKANDQAQGITDLADLCTRVANLIRALDPDVLTIEEGPSSIKEMNLFIETYLSDNNVPLFDSFGGFGFRDTQRNYALVKRCGNFKNARLAADNLSKGLEDPWDADIDGSLELKKYEFTRVPLVIEGEIGANNDILKIVTLHTKSKYVYQGMTLWRSEDPAKRRKYIRMSIENRRRIATEAMRIRNYLDDLLENNLNEYVIVNGDFNDGPNLDYFENYYLYHSVTDIILGSTFNPERIFNHGFIHSVPANERYTVVFEDFVDPTRTSQILLDHIILSPAMKCLVTDSGIAHKEYEAQEKSGAGVKERERFPSDHRPVYVVLNSS